MGGIGGDREQRPPLQRRLLPPGPVDRVQQKDTLPGRGAEVLALGKDLLF